MNLLTSIFLFAIVACSLILNGCLKSSCTDQIKNSELFGLWYYYRISKFNSKCDSTGSIGKDFSYSCYKLRFERAHVQFSEEKFIEEALGDTTIYTSDSSLIDSTILAHNNYRFYTWNYEYRPIIEKSWFVDNNKLLICENNSMCFESECNVYTWKIENGTLFLQNDQILYVLTREDLFEKIRNSVKTDTSE